MSGAGSRLVRAGPPCASVLECLIWDDHKYSSGCFSDNTAAGKHEAGSTRIEEGTSQDEGSDDKDHLPTRLVGYCGA